VILRSPLPTEDVDVLPDKSPDNLGLSTPSPGRKAHPAGESSLRRATAEESSAGQAEEHQDPAFKLQHLHSIEAPQNVPNIGSTDCSDCVDHDETRCRDAGRLISSQGHPQ